MQHQCLLSLSQQCSTRPAGLITVGQERHAPSQFRHQLGLPVVLAAGAPR